jgi:hypothetical protein
MAAHDQHGTAYRLGLDTIEEPVISSHFMQRLCGDAHLALYDEHELSAKSVTLPPRTLTDCILPAMVRASRAFARDRAAAARRRAAAQWRDYGLAGPSSLGPAEFITEVMFDRQFRRGPRRTESRQALRARVARQIERGAPIEMVIPALPFKFSCPLKTRGQLPDLAEANFMLGLYEIAAAIEELYAGARPDPPAPLARFTVVCDGSRFNEVVNEPDAMIAAYRDDLTRWIRLLQLEHYVQLIDYRALLRERLPLAAREAKEALRSHAQRQYTGVMCPILDPCDMPATLRAAARLEPDPERSNPDGRFVSLLKSLVFTVNYRSLDPYKAWPADRYRSLYRELTGHIFEPFQAGMFPGPPRAVEDTGAVDSMPAIEKERLRRMMLREVWTAAIAYIAEIKSDRELASNPVSTCLPDHVRWTIHAKPGQLGLLTPTVFGTTVQAWAGAAVFKRTGQCGIRLCTLPVLALEGAGAIPVVPESADPARAAQPLFYIYPDLGVAGLDDFLARLATGLVRRRAS